MEEQAQDMPYVLRPFVNGLRAVNRVGEYVVFHAGTMAILAWRSVSVTLRGRVTWREFITQAYSMGVQSIPLVMVTAILSGIVTSQQGGYQFTGSIPLYILG